MACTFQGRSDHGSLGSSLCYLDRFGTGGVNFITLPLFSHRAVYSLSNRPYGDSERLADYALCSRLTPNCSERARQFRVPFNLSAIGLLATSQQDGLALELRSVVNKRVDSLAMTHPGAQQPVCLSPAIFLQEISLSPAIRQTDRWWKTYFFKETRGVNVCSVISRYLTQPS